MAVDDLQRGLVNYYADNYEPAVAALLRYRDAYAADAATSAPGDSTALYHLGRADAAAGRDAQAIAAWQALVDSYPGDGYWTNAYFQIAFLQPYPQDTGTFEAFAAAAPAAPEAPDGLFRAARLHERNNDLAERPRCGCASPRSSPPRRRPPMPPCRPGWCSTGPATTPPPQRFELAATLGTDPDQHARAWLWQGKVRERLGDEAGARAAYEKGRFLARTVTIRYAPPSSSGDAPFWPPARYDFDYDRAAEQTAAEPWLRATFPLAQSVDHPSGLQPGVYQESRFQRGRAVAVGPLAGGP